VAFLIGNCPEAKQSKDWGLCLVSETRVFRGRMRDGHPQMKQAGKRRQKGKIRKCGDDGPDDGNTGERFFECNKTGGIRAEIT
jgi:hypothetical protein